MSTFPFCPRTSARLRPSPELGFYLPPQLRHLRRLHPILRQHEQLTLLGPDMALEQNAETVHLLVRAGLDRRGFHPKLAMVAQQYVDQRRFHAQHCAECGKQQFFFKLQMVDQPIFEERTNVLGAQFGLAL